MRIPRVIHQINLGERALPDVILRSMERLRGDNPAWTHVLWNDAQIHDYLRQRCSPLEQAVFESIAPEYGAARADWFRYLLMLREGGLYLDLKSSASRPLDAIVQDADRYLLSSWDRGAGSIGQDWGRHPELQPLASLPDGEWQQWHIATTPGHPFLREVVQEVLQRVVQYDALRCGVGQLGVLRTTGPIAYTQAIERERVRASRSARQATAWRIFEAEASGLVFSVLPARNALQGPHYSTLRTPLIVPTPQLQALASWVSRARVASA